MKRKILIFTLLVLFGISLCSIFYPFDRSYSHLDKKELDYLVIDRERGIKDLCSLPGRLETAITNLGRPDEYAKENPFMLAMDNNYRYHRYGLWITSYSGFLESFGDVDCIQFRFNEETLKRIRLYDEVELAHPLPVEKVIGLYGETQEYLSEDAEKDRLHYEFENTTYVFFHEDGKVHGLNIIKK